MRLIEHSVRLQGKKALLRPMTENDWDILFRWNNDPEVLYYVENEDIDSQSMEQVHRIYRQVSQNAYCFIIVVNNRPAGECWLQKMNLKRIKEKYPGRDCRRIDIMIGEKDLWGKGIGTDVIGTLTAFGFEVEMADMIFGCGVADYNPRSRKAFTKNGYIVDAMNEQPSGGKAKVCYDLVIDRERFTGEKKGFRQR
jgi:RimJ/RimL family protein N-acetyltransferase